MTRLFEAPVFIADQYSDAQIAKGIWYIFGVGSEYTSVFYSDEVSLEARSRCVRAVATVYTDLFDRVCGLRGEDIDAEIEDSDVDGAVYMIWDMGGIEHVIVANAEDPLSLAGFHVLEAALMKCITAACRQSALHGLGHVIGSHAPTEPIALHEPLLYDRLTLPIHAARPPEWLKEYAAAARAGNVQ